MFSELPKLFDRDFAVGYLLPAAGFVAANVAMKDIFGLFKDLYPYILIKPADYTVNIAVWGFASLLVGILLLITNYEIYRFLEGYGTYNPLRLWRSVEGNRYKRFKHELDLIEQDKGWYEGRGEAVPAHYDALEIRRLWQEKVLFPPEGNLLPTAFGNIIRAFEMHPNVLYGIDPINGWDRLQAVISEDFMKLINGAKAQTDFWVNLWVLGWLVVAEYIAVATYKQQLVSPWLPAVSAATAIIASRRAKVAASGWGSLVKSAFDVFLPALRKKLSYPQPPTVAEESGQWESFSTAVVFRHRGSLPDRVLPAEAEEDKAEEDKD